MSESISTVEKPSSEAASASEGLNLLAASFGRASRTYGAGAGVQEAMSEWLSEWLPADRSGAALEIGAGTGLFTRRLVPWTGPLTASDLSEEMCAVGRTLVPQARWATMEAEKPIGGPWDWIFSCSMLQWAADPEKVFSSWRKSLSPRGRAPRDACAQGLGAADLAQGGRVLAGVFAAGSLAEWNALAGEAIPLRWKTPQEWRAHIESAGLRVVREDSVCRVFSYPSALALLRSVHDVGGAPHRRYSAGKLRRHLRDYEARHRTVRGVNASWVFYRFEAS
jgi:SAM-dependent methyltransferase